jgi:hypothetical protein
MRPTGQLGPVHLALAVAALCGHLAGCTSWRPAGVAPRQLFSDDPPGRVRVTKPDGTILVLTHPHLLADSLYGSARVRGSSRGSTVAVSLTDLRQLEVRQASSGKSIGLLLGVAAVGVATYFLVVSATASN